MLSLAIHATTNEAINQLEIIYIRSCYIIDNNTDYLTSVHTPMFNILSGKLFATVSLSFSCGVPMSLPNIFCKIVYDARLAGNRTKHHMGVNALSSGTEYFASVRTFRHNSVQLSFDYIDFRGVHLASAYKCGSAKLRKICPRGDANPTNS